MDERVIEFIAALRSAGVRISIAESADALRAIQTVGVIDRERFKTALKATLVKEPADVPAFERCFPMYFGHEGPPMQAPQGLSPEQQQQLQRAIEQLRQQLQDLMRMLAQGQQPTREQMQRYAQRAGFSRNMRGGRQLQEWLTERMLREMGLTPEQLKEALEALMKQLKQQGMSAEGREEVRQTVQGNAESLREQVARFVGQSLIQQANESPRRQRIDDLMNRPLSSLSESEADELRNHVRRLVARLRSRAALRMRRGKHGHLDAKGTIRHNLRNMGVPMELKLKRRRLKPKITMIVDVSTSMRPVAEFMLRMMYEMQDQVSKARSFAFISDIHEVSMVFAENRPQEAVEIVLQTLPPGHYNTDLGNSLNTFCQSFADAVDHRTTLIIVGDGRNNFNDPRLDLMQALKARARRVLWFNPEPPYQWGTGDSDMLAYVPFCDAVHQVATLKQLADAIDHLFQHR
ncbi:MAG: VWA domain-containing protein [Anaerolineae bacterium]|nr:VWA domain-containing protein [Thermoflexales bacterium]MDW8395249.1 VWA domain-containing protein [Anaerolineae bacterium]